MASEDAIVIAAVIAAIASISTLLMNTRLTDSRDKRRIFWEKELSRFFELEEISGRLVQDLLAYRCRSDEDKSAASDKLEYIHAAAGRFLRYPDVAAALRELHHAAGWYMAQDRQHETRQEFEQARKDVVDAYEKFLLASDIALNRHSWWRKLF